MSKQTLHRLRSLFIGGIVLILGQQTLFAQDALTSVKINIQNLIMSPDKKTISYDVYLQDVDAANPIALPGFLFRLAVPQSELGSSAKTVSVTNESTELGVDGISMMQSGSNWLMQFTNANLIVSYKNALKLPETFPGKRVGTFNISNADGSSFSNPQSFTATYSGDMAQTKSTISIFKYNTTTLAPNASAPQPETNFTGLKTYSMSASKTQLTISGTTANSKPYDGTTTASVVPGTLSGVSESDAGNVVVSATATYDNSNAGTGKTITVTYSLSGSAADNYLAPVSNTIATGVITKKTLSIGNPTISLSKLYDGTASAAVTAVGTLTGVVSGETVDVTATGAYSNANAGVGKTITVTYALAGAFADNYQAPDIYSVNTGEITKLFTVKAYLEGLWNTSTLALNKCKEWDDGVKDLVDKFAGDIADTITVELHGSPYSNITYTFNNLLLHQDGTITSDGISSVAVPSSIAGSFYLTIKSRNHLETTSSSLVSFDANTIDYDFTDFVSKAYASDESFMPTKQIDGKWMIHAGDIISDTSYPEINLVDLYEIFNHRSSLTDTYGYSAVDLNGDGFFDESDLYMLFANRNLYMYKE